MKKYILTILAFLSTMVCFITYNLIGATILPDGTLSEPFYLIPLAYLFFFIGIISLIISYIKNKK